MSPGKIYTLFISLVALVSLGANIFLLQNRSAGNKETFIVSEVIDGDTFTIKAGTETRRVRLIGVNAPEPGKCLSDDATDTLSDLLSGNKVALEDQFLDPYGRIMANVFVEKLYVNKEMLRLGLGRMDYYQQPRREELKKVYEEARENKRGVYSKRCLSLTPPTSSDSSTLCDVKGNMDFNTKKKIYFLPTCKNYIQVTIDLSTDDQWFCSEREAQEAGFVKSTTCD